MNSSESLSVCNLCFAIYEPKRFWQKYCSVKCQYTHANLQKRNLTGNKKQCARCGKSLEGKRKQAIYCSKSCKSMDHTFKHRSKTRPTSTARRREIYLRDEGICYMCGVQTDFSAFELDHLIPVKFNGSNLSTNLSVACRSCNRRRGTKIGIRQVNRLKELRSANDN